MELEDLEEREETREDEKAEAGDDGSEASLEELIDRKSKQKEGEEDSEEEDSVLTIDREDRIGGALPGKVAPKQATEFVCRSCFLVKHQSQLANKKRMLCKDCA
jgi:hypothetical protein